MNLAAYIRVSTTSQASDGYGLEVQRKDITKWAKANGHRIVRWCADEGVSGTKDALDRDGLSCVIDGIESGAVEGLVVAKLDRLARKLHVQEACLAHVWRNGGTAFTVESGEVLQDDPDDPMRTAMRQMVGVFAELERSSIALRMRKGRAAKAESGGYAYGAPGYGVKAANGMLVVDEAEAAVIGRVCEMRSAGASLRQIAAVLNAEGVTTKRGKAWTSVQVSRAIDPEARERNRRAAAIRREVVRNAAK